MTIAAIFIEHSTGGREISCGPQQVIYYVNITRQIQYTDSDRLKKTVDDAQYPHSYISYARTKRIADYFHWESLIQKESLNRYTCNMGVGLFVKELCNRPIDRIGMQHIVL